MVSKRDHNLISARENFPAQHSFSLLQNKQFGGQLIYL